MKSTVIVNADIACGTISRHIYGHFAEHLGRCIYEGIWVGEDSPIPNTHGIRNDVLAALRKINIPNLRWPGGCFADEYHWMDGIGPRNKRKRMVNTHWGGVVENNHFGTHEFMLLCELLGCEPYICGNVGSGTVREMQEWIEYMTFGGESPMADLRRENGRDKPWRLKYFGIGNENWGCGGSMRPEYYADVYRRYQTYVRNYGDNKIYKIACGPGNVQWTEVMMREAGKYMHGLSLHHYTVAGPSWQNKGSATDFTEQEWLRAMVSAWKTDELITRHSAIMDQYDPEKRVALIVDEWGSWCDVEPGTNPGFLYQQNTLRDAMVAATHFHIFHEHCDRVHMANIAQMINVLQAVILTEGSKMIVTPTYHVFDMFQVHQDATRLHLAFESERLEFNGAQVPKVSASASRNADGKIHISLCNIDLHEEATLDFRLRGGIAGNVKVTGQILTAEKMNAHNTFEQPENVKPAEYREVKMTDEGFCAVLPPKSVVVLALG